MFDDRWRNVRGQIERRDDGDVEFRVEIVNGPRARVGRVVRVEAAKLADAPGLYGYTLDRIVREIDKILHA